MLSSQRQAEIPRLLAVEESCTVAGLALRLAVSGETVRRDLRALEARSLIVKVHGGAALPSADHEPPFQQRMRENAEAKRAIARLAAAQVANGDSVILDAGSTTAYVAQALSRHRDLLVVTNAVDIARSLATRNGNRVYMAGGELRADDGAAFGPSAIAFVEQFRVRLALLSIGGIDLEDGYMNFRLAEAELSRVVIRRAEQVLVVADASKLGRRGLVRVAGLEAVHGLITEAPPPEAFAERLAAAGTRVLVAET